MAAGRFLPLLLLPLLSPFAAPSQAQPGSDGSALPAPPQPQHLSDLLDASYAEHCAAPRVTGPCRAAFPRWFYSNGTCQEFIYGGCRGNKNNFQTREECLSRCHPPGGDAAVGAAFPSMIGLALGFLLAVPAVVLVGYALKSCWKKGEPPTLGGPWSHRNDKEHLMSNTDPI